jgi:CxxC-x17-CxxC domain-containing protein
MYVDKTLRCRECAAEFIFSAGEQDFFAKHGLLNDPGRCPACRQKRRQGMASERVTGERGPRETHTIICAECGAEDQVPFQPRYDKPVYCAACYERMRVHR